MSEVCDDNRFELIGEFKGKLVEGTNIETSPEEMAVLDNILFRFWQMGWLDKLKAMEPRVLTLEEVKQHNNQDGCVWFEQPTYNADAAFVRKDDFMTQVISPYILGEQINHGYWTNGNYGKTWRCWTARPTDEQRKAVKWE